ncbi:MAG: hypothetical protein JWO03_1713 [Bacteroidetes bacterium]|nr:hypothetical protein [Bacteroidota bacterium]
MRSTTLILLLSTLAYGAHSQSFSFMDDFLNKRAVQEVKLLSEFADRFNMTDTVFLIDTTIKPSRYLNILSLFNRANKKFHNDSSVISFTNDILRDSFLIDFTDSNWYAVAHAVFVYRGVKRNIPLTLKHVKNQGRGYSWVIVGANIDALNVKLDRIESQKIDPVDNELSFLSLSKGFNSKNGLLSYTSADFDIDYLSVFLFLAESGTINFTQIDSVSYHFLNTPNWIFKVEYFNRMDLNCGWLISEISPSTDTQKAGYKNLILHLQ